MTLAEDALEVLRRITGDAAAGFRDGQLEAIGALVDERRKVLVVQRTGWGKSAVYFVATRLLRDRGAGPTILISPLLALMRNQLAMAGRGGIRAETINSDNLVEWDAIERRVASDDIDLLVISPERLSNKRFAAAVLPDLVHRVGLLVVDEAHCISDWGHDFRPDYRRISRVMSMLPRGVPVLCTTATANDRVVTDIVEQLGDNLAVFRGTLDRESLRLAVLDLPQPAERLAWLAREVPRLTGSGIVYCLTVRDTERVASWLTKRGIAAVAYSGESDGADRPDIELALLSNSVKVVVATSALGMGFDKPDLGFVIHYQSPGSPIAYYQQVGRAGRALDAATVVLLRGHEDEDIQDWFIRTAFPSQDEAVAVVTLLAERGTALTLNEVKAAVNVKHTRLTNMLKVLEVEGAVEKTGSGYRRTLKPWEYPEARVEQITALRRAEQLAMRDYATTRSCRMAFLRALLDDRDASACGRCDNCTGVHLQAGLDPHDVSDAIGHIRSQRLVIAPRKRWPPGMQPTPPKIVPLEEGRALSVYGDGAWGSVVKAYKQRGVPFPQELLSAAAALVRSWRPQPIPTWVTAVPSTTASGLIADAASRLAAELGLPFTPVLARTRAAPPQKEMENSQQQVRNVYGAFMAVAPVPTGAVLLVDDIFDSGWTLTVAGQLLLQAGSGPVHPLVLAQASGD